MTINSEKIDNILDNIESEIGGENRGDLIFRGENGSEFDFEITDDFETVNIYHDSILLNEVVYDGDDLRFAEDIIDAIYDFLED